MEMNFYYMQIYHKQSIWRLSQVIYLMLFDDAETKTEA